MSDAEHTPYSKRVMARDLAQLMQGLGLTPFHFVGHDRGGRVGHRFALDDPGLFLTATFLDIAPTAVMYERTNMEFARRYFWWFFLIQPEPLPEKPPEEKAETPEKTDGKKSIIPKTIVSAPVQQWYKTNKALYNAEVAAMRKEFNDPNIQPHFMSDGRMYWLVKTRPNLGRGFNTMTYTMKLVYDPDHPKVRYSSSVKPYLVSPTLGELQKIVNMLPHIPLDADGKKLIPHTLTDNRGERYICSSDVADVHAEDTCTTSAVTSFRFAYRWLMVFELAIRKPEAWKDFQAHGKI